MNPLAFTLVCLAGWMNRRQQLVIGEDPPGGGTGFIPGGAEEDDLE